MSKAYCNNPNFEGVTYLFYLSSADRLARGPYLLRGRSGRTEEETDWSGIVHRKQVVGKRRRERVVSSIMNSRFQIHL
jgi:hypothetical protein